MAVEVLMSTKAADNVNQTKLNALAFLWNQLRRARQLDSLPRHGWLCNIDYAFPLR